MTDVRTFPRGIDITSPGFREQLNDLVDAVNAILRVIQPGFGGYSLLVGARFQFQAWPTWPTEQDYFIARRLDDTGATTEDVNVALPWELRSTPFDGQTVRAITYTYTDHHTRDADDGGGAVEEILVTSFESGLNEFTAIRNIHRGTGVKTSAGERVEWLMLNQGGMWSRDSSTTGGT